MEIHAQAPPEYGRKAFYREIASDLNIKNSVIDEIMEILRQEGFLDHDNEVWVRLCLDEVIINAIKHGNKEDLTKKVLITLYLDTNLWAIRVEDEGEGFAVESVPDVNDAESLEMDHGRGILLIKSYMDEIWYYDKGNRVQLKKIKKSRLQKYVDNILAFFRLK